ncbi:ATP-binding region ATPase domain protein [Crinalium epipsammum PCC 9333]|uniref:ATP-binding region ATPase domain protein n=1 Tax=Crinalium epipsammum PCC 9333 TaxID=1173022 RepID=K9W0W9_9CYAN|nr:ATP-binding protein [Crinalium epipsammum]AFZ13444.1 ATP-binding region ATPase domain protein [Crinalium epipsammum PCC 9333]
MSLIVTVPTINDKAKDFDRLFQLWTQVQENTKEVIFDFSQCFFLRQNAVAFLGGLARLIESRGGKVIFDWDTVKNHVRMNLKQNGFMYAFNSGEEPWQGNSIPYREDRYQDIDGLTHYLAEQWLGKDWVHISDLLRSVIVSTAWEIYANAFEHGRTEIGVFSCGQHYPNLGELKLSVVDFGVGIPQNVRDFQKNPNLPADQALQWAFQKGTTTRGGRVTGGIGLDYLKQFVHINKGKLQILSNDGCATIDKQQEVYEKRPSFFGGTLVNITLLCDESYYALELEPDDEPLF